MCDFSLGVLVPREHLHFVFSHSHVCLKVYCFMHTLIFEFRTKKALWKEHQLQGCRADVVLGPHDHASAPCCCDPGCSCNTWVAHECREATVYLHMLVPAKACLGWVFICTLSRDQGRFLAYLVRHSEQWASDQEPLRSLPAHSSCLL